jgi:hypothetical protein
MSVKNRNLRLLTILDHVFLHKVALKGGRLGHTKAFQIKEKGRG